jgi:hypothetical protein
MTCELIKTSAMQKRLLEAGIIRPKVKPPTKKEISRQEIQHFSGRFDRDKLYEEVWETPLTRVAKAYGVSRPLLARAVRRYVCLCRHGVIGSE